MSKYLLIASCLAIVFSFCSMSCQESGLGKGPAAVTSASAPAASAAPAAPTGQPTSYGFIAFVTILLTALLSLAAFLARG